MREAIMREAGKPNHSGNSRDGGELLGQAEASANGGSQAEEGVHHNAEASSVVANGAGGGVEEGESNKGNNSAKEGESAVGLGGLGFVGVL